MTNMAVGVAGIQGTGSGINPGHGLQHPIGVTGNQPGSHLHGVLTNEEERKVTHPFKCTHILAISKCV